MSESLDYSLCIKGILTLNNEICINAVEYDGSAYNVYEVLL